MRKKQIYTIGLIGLTFLSGNKGCSALAYSFFNMLNNIAKKNNIKLKLIIISRLNMNLHNLKNDTIMDIKCIEYHFKDFKHHSLIKKEIKECDYIFDFTEGDSFSDIYGVKQLITNAYLKLICINSEKKLILGPQTYGPFNKKISKIIAKKILKKSFAVFSRDDISTDYIKQISGRTVDTSIDVAFELPYQKDLYKFNNKKKKIGINISGLLWNNGYTGNNEFGLKTNYKEYCISLIEKLADNYEIHLIPHVICENYDNIENDLRVCKELAEKYKYCILAPSFDTPMDAKSYISGMDVFIGARMHSDIAAFSSNVAVIPFSYSRKFEGLFSTLNYKYCIDGKNETTDSAIKKTLYYLDNIDTLKSKLFEAKSNYKSRIELFNDFLNKILI